MAAPAPRHARGPRSPARRAAKGRRRAGEAQGQAFGGTRPALARWQCSANWARRIASERGYVGTPTATSSPTTPRRAVRHGSAPRWVRSTVAARVADGAGARRDVLARAEVSPSPSASSGSAPHAPAVRGCASVPSGARHAACRRKSSHGATPATCGNRTSPPAPPPSLWRCAPPRAGSGRPSSGATGARWLRPGRAPRSSSSPPLRTGPSCRWAATARTSAAATEPSCATCSGTSAPGSPDGMEPAPKGRRAPQAGQITSRPAAGHAGGGALGPGVTVGKLDFAALERAYAGG